MNGVFIYSKTHNSYLFIHSQIIKKNQFSIYCKHSILGTKPTCFLSQSVKVVFYREVHWVSCHSFSEVIGSLTKPSQILLYLFELCTQSLDLFQTCSPEQTRNKNKSNFVTLVSCLTNLFPQWIPPPQKLTTKKKY